jgi:23S rRNA G2445 N2-methylase RlmL
MNEWFAITTRGLEFVSEREITTLPGVTNVQRGYRHVLFSHADVVAPLLQLRTVDDLFVHVATWQGIERPRSTLEQLRKFGSLLDLEPAAATCETVRPMPDLPSFSITASFVGKRNYSSDEIKAAVAEGIEAEYGWAYQANDAIADLNVRLFIEHTMALVGVRLGAAALHERPYKRVHKSGSLKPPVAAAMLALAAVAPEQHVVDPCCGVGTLPIEAALTGVLARGGDQDPEALQGARENAAAAGVQVCFEQWDAQALPIAEGSVDGVVSNLPWGRQIVVDASLGQFYERCLAEMRRILVPGGSIVVLTSVPELLQGSGLQREDQLEISLFGQTPSIVRLRRV